MKSLEIRQDLCKGCELCIKFCKRNVLCLSKNMNTKGYFSVEAARPADCSGCRDCEVICPDRAIFVSLERRRAGDSKGRR